MGGHLESRLSAIFEADRALRREEKALLGEDPDRVGAALAQAVQEALALGDEAESAMRLERLADLCAQVHGPDMVDALIAILSSDAQSARIEAYEALQDVAFERYAEVARGIERLLERPDGGHALRELPFLLAEVGEPSARPLIARFLKRDDINVQASAIEALAVLGDEAAIAEIAPFRDDGRRLEPEDEDEPSATLGELATEAIEALGGAEEE
ncbi:MAG: hypothetical protein OXT09_08225 [Myxococcales bacterium]|nr:hypothetical protein [Myxococcales bacterium]